MPKEIYLSGLTADQLSEMIRESLRDELQQFRPARPKSETKYLTRQETARRLRIAATRQRPPGHADFARNAHRLGEPR